MRSQEQLYTVPYKDYTDEELRCCKDGIALEVLEQRVRGIRDLSVSEIHSLLTLRKFVALEADNINEDNYEQGSLLLVLDDGSHLRIAGYEGLGVELIERPTAPIE